MMKRAALAFSVVAVIGLASCGCSNSRPFWMAGKAGNNSTDVAASGAGQRAEAERSLEGPLALARLAEHGGSSVDAERLYRSILEKNPDSPGAAHRLAIMQSQKGHFDEAEQLFQRALELKPDDPAILADFGYHYYLQNQFDSAEPLFRRALEIRPDHESATNNLAMLLGEKGDDRAALSLFRRTGSESEAYNNMGFVYARRGDFAKAKEAYSQALTINPQMRVAAEALVQLSQFEAKTNRMIAEQPRPQTDARQSVTQYAPNTAAYVSQAPTNSSASSRVSMASASVRLAANNSPLGGHSSSMQANNADYIYPNTLNARALPVVYPEAVSSTGPEEMKRLPPAASAEHTRGASVAATMKAIETGFATTY